MQNSEMMIRMKIGICDDEQEQGLKTKRYVESCFENSEDFYVELYDPYNLDFDIDTKRFDCDLLITDIQFENCEFDGIGIVNKINESCCKCQYKNVQKVENKNVHFIPLSLQTGCQEMLAFP